MILCVLCADSLQRTCEVVTSGQPSGGYVNTKKMKSQKKKACEITFTMHYRTEFEAQPMVLGDIALKQHGYDAQLYSAW